MCTPQTLPTDLKLGRPTTLGYAIPSRQAGERGEARQATHLSVAFPETHQATPQLRPGKSREESNIHPLPAIITSLGQILIIFALLDLIISIFDKNKKDII